MLRVGDLPTSKPLRQWLHGLDGALQIAFDPENAWQDPAGAVATIVSADPRVLAPEAPREERGVAGGRGAAPTGRRAKRSRPRLRRALRATRGRRARRRACRADATLVVASSMPVRDVETFFPARDAPAARALQPRRQRHRRHRLDRVRRRRGAAGRTVLLTGDVALAHDIGGLLAARRLGSTLTIVLIDNDGGGIFHFLPVEREGADFERHVATPHGLDFAHAAALYGLGHERVDDPAAFRAALDDALGGGRRRSSRCGPTARRTSSCTGASGKRSCSPSAAAT